MNPTSFKPLVREFACIVSKFCFLSLILFTPLALMQFEGKNSVERAFTEAADGLDVELKIELLLLMRLFIQLSTMEKMRNKLLLMKVSKLQFLQLSLLIFQNVLKQVLQLALQWAILDNGLKLITIFAKLRHKLKGVTKICTSTKKFYFFKFVTWLI